MFLASKKKTLTWYALKKKKIRESSVDYMTWNRDIRAKVTPVDGMYFSKSVVSWHLFGTKKLKLFFFIFACHIHGSHVFKCLLMIKNYFLQANKKKTLIQCMATMEKKVGLAKNKILSYILQFH